MSKSTATEKYITANSGKKISEVTDAEKLGDIDSNSQQGKDILSAYSAAQLRENSIETAHKNQELAASKAYDLSQKYMAAQNEANGLSGLGIADTTAIRASSQYQNALADAYATREQSLTDNYAKLQDDVGTIRGQWASIKEAEKQDVMDKALSGTDFASVNAYLDAAVSSGKITEEDKKSALDQWYFANGTTESDAQMQSANQPKPTAAKLEGDYNSADSGDAGDNFEIKMGSNTYKVERGNEASDTVEEALNKAAKGNPSLGQVMTYNGRVYIYLHNNNDGVENWVIVQQRYLGNDGFKDLCKKLGVTPYARGATDN